MVDEHATIARGAGISPRFKSSTPKVAYIGGVLPSLPHGVSYALLIKYPLRGQCNGAFEVRGLAPPIIRMKSVRAL